MKKLFTLAALCIAGASAFNASAVEAVGNFYGFGTDMGSFNELKKIQFCEINASYDSANVGDEWKWAYESKFNCNYDPGNHTSFNSGWIRDGFLYGIGNYYSDCSWLTEDFFNNVFQMDASGNLVKTIKLGNNSKYGYIIKAVLNPNDDMLYCWTTNFVDRIYFGKISPDNIENFSSDFTEIKDRAFKMSNLPLTFCQKDDLFYYLTNDLTFTSISTDGIERTVGTLKDVDTRFRPAIWGVNDYRAGLAMIYSKDLDKFIWNTPVGTNPDYSTSVRLYSFALPTETESATSLYNETIVMTGICGSIGYWTAFVEPGELKEVESGTPKAPEKVEIVETDIENRYMIFWTPVTECVEADKAIDAANLTYRVLLNDTMIEENIAESVAYVEIEPQSKPMEYTAHVWAVTPNAESAEATSNTITVGASSISNIATDAVNTIYTVFGTKVNASSPSELTSGLYIINGKKVVVK